MRVWMSALLCGLASGLVMLATPAQAMIMGDVPTIVVQRDGNMLLSYEVEGLMATKGMVQAQVSDRFALEVSATITDGTSVIDITFPPSVLPLLADKDTSMKQGSEVALTGVGQDFPAELSAKLAQFLDDGTPLTLLPRITLVLTDGSGAQHVLGTIEASTFVGPEPIDS